MEGILEMASNIPSVYPNCNKISQNIKLAMRLIFKQIFRIIMVLKTIAPLEIKYKKSIQTTYGELYWSNCLN